MLVRRLLFMLFVTVMLQGCVSPKMAEEMQQGRVSFAEGNFKQAFHELLPVAVKGKPQAQYAVGYMYYNGYGVTRDAESGIFWMNQAAIQCYAPAKKALCLIQQRNIQKANRSCSTEAKQGDISLKEKGSSDLFNKKKSSLPLPLTKIDKATFLKKASIEKIVQKDEVLQSLDSNSLVKTSSYTVQLFGGYSSRDAKEFQSKFSVKKATHIWRTERNGEKWFVLTYGQYQTVSDAKVALNNLPETLRELHPWIRGVNKLQRV